MPWPVVRSGLTRRSLLEWLGKGTVIGLASPLVTACGAAAGDTAGQPAEDGTFPFYPGLSEGEVFRDWRVRTVDPQDLAEILARWRLRVDGLVDEPLELDFSQLVALERQDQVTDFHCVEGWSVYDVPWNGVHIGTLLAAAGAKTGATHITFHTIGGEYNESLPLDVALEATTMLAYGVCDASLTLDHGFPLRLVVPRLLGYKNAKYLTRLELTDHAVEGYWVKAGYPYEGEVPEDRLREGKY